MGHEHRAPALLLKRTMLVDMDLVGWADLDLHPMAARIFTVHPALIHMLRAPVLGTNRLNPKIRIRIARKPAKN